MYSLVIHTTFFKSSINRNKCTKFFYTEMDGHLNNKNYQLPEHLWHIYIFREQTLNTLFTVLSLKTNQLYATSEDKSLNMKKTDTIVSWQFHTKLQEIKKFYSFGVSCGAGNFSQDGSTPQISLAYSAIVLSLENLPDEAIFIMAIFVHSSTFVYMSLTLSWHFI